MDATPGCLHLLGRLLAICVQLLLQALLGVLQRSLLSLDLVQLLLQHADSSMQLLYSLLLTLHLLVMVCKTA